MAKTMYCYIKDSKYEKYLVAGDNYDGKLYHQEDNKRDNAKWVFEKVSGGLLDNQNIIYYRIKDAKHNKYLVAGDIEDNHVYHQDAQNKKNALWSVTMDQTLTGFGGYTITDALHSKLLVAGTQYDGHVYHQARPEKLSPEKLWKIEMIEQSDDIDDYPDFYMIPGTSDLITLTTGDPSNVLEQPATVLQAKLINNSDSPQVMKFVDEKTVVTTDTIIVSNSQHFEVGLAVSIELGLGAGSSIAQAKVAVTTKSTWVHTSTDTHTIRQERKFSIETKVNVKPNHKMLATITMPNVKHTLPYKALFNFRIADGRILSKTITGTWTGVSVVACIVEYNDK